MAAIDIVLVAVMIYAIVRGAMKGFIVSIASMFGVFISLFVAKNYGEDVMHFILSKVEWTAETNYIVSFVVVFLLMMILVRFGAIAVSKLANMVMLGWLDKLLGAVFTWVKYLVIISACLYVFDRINNHLHFASEEYLQSSALYQPVKSIAEYLVAQDFSDAKQPE
jgi:membrane protein required for colicin V production